MASPTVEPGCASSGREVVLLLWQPEAVAWESWLGCWGDPTPQGGKGRRELGESRTMEGTRPKQLLPIGTNIAVASLGPDSVHCTGTEPSTVLDVRTLSTYRQDSHPALVWAGPDGDGCTRLHASTPRAGHRRCTELCCRYSIPAFTFLVTAERSTGPCCGPRIRPCAPAGSERRLDCLAFAAYRLEGLPSQTASLIPATRTRSPSRYSSSYGKIYGLPPPPNKMR